MQTFGTRKWPSGSIGDLVGEYDGLKRREYIRENSASRSKCNGLGHSFGHGRTLTFRIPRDRYGNFHLRILAILRHQEDECDRLAGTLYTKDLTQEQVGEVFQDIWRVL
jgi:putative transposase